MLLVLFLVHFMDMEGFNIDAMPGVPFFPRKYSISPHPFLGKSKSLLSATNESAVYRNYREGAGV